MGNLLTLRNMIQSEPEPAPDEAAPEPQAPPEALAPEPAAEPARPLHLVLTAPPTGHAHHMLMSAQDWVAVLRRQIKAKRDTPGGIGAWLDNGHAPTNAQQREYAQKRAWVHPGDEGGWVEQVGIAYYATLGKWIPALCNGTGWIFARMLRIAWAAGVATVLAGAAVFAYAGTTAGFAMIAVLAALLGAGWGLAELAAEAKRRAFARYEPSRAADGTDEDPQWD